MGIVSWNTADLLDRCLTVLPAALEGLDASIVVVDNASSDACVEVAAGHRGVTVVPNPTNVGYATAMNQALAGAEAPVLIALNPDTEPGPGSLTALVDRLIGDPLVGLVAPRLVSEDGSTQYSGRRFPSLAVAAAGCFLPVRWHRGRLGRRMLLEYAERPVAPTDVDWAIGAVHVIRADAVAGRSPYDERWFMYAEDIELCWRLAQQGWRRRLEADIAVRHVGNASGEQAWGDAYYRRCLDAIYDWYQRDRGPVKVRAWAAVNTMGVATRAVFGSVVRRDANHVAWLWQALRYHARVLVTGVPPLTRPPGEPRSNLAPEPVMDRRIHQQMRAVEDHHWWFSGRREIIRAMLGSVRSSGSGRVLDAGCGGGGNLREYTRFGDVIGVDMAIEGLGHARRRGYRGVAVSTLDRLPFLDEQYDLVCATDVIEHVADDVGALRELRRVAAGAGHLLVTVPAYQWLWSDSDVQLGHHRRYQAQEIAERCQAAGWTVLRTSYFNSALLPAIAAVRWVRQRWSSLFAANEVEQTGTLANVLLRIPLTAEARLLAAGLRLPAGVSIVCLCRK